MLSIYTAMGVSIIINKSINTKNALIYFISIILLLFLVILNYFKVTPSYINTLSNSYTEPITNEKVKDTIISNRQTKTIGFIKAITNENGIILLTIDPIEFYIFDEADIERSKDGLDYSVVPYYIRNLNTDSITYTLGNDADTKLCVYLVNDTYSNASINVPVPMDKFIDYVSKNTTNDPRSLLFWFELKDNSIISTEMQYTP